MNVYKNFFLFFSLALITLPCYGTCFIYPVAFDHLTNNLYILYQKNNNHRELWQHDIINKAKKLILGAPYFPAYVAVIPGEQSLSFIDNDIIKIKQFHKRSAHVIDLTIPLYNFSQLHWIDDEHCYASAQLRDQFGIFEIHSDGNVRTIIHDDYCDYLLPQKKDAILFCVQRNRKKGYHAILKIDYFKQEKPYSIYFTQDAIADVSMIDQNLGFFITYNAQENVKMVNFSCYMLMHKNNVYEDRFLFNFSLPLFFIQSLPEALYLYAPHYSQCEQGLYYVDFFNNFLQIFYYDIIDKSTHMVTKGNANSCSPFVVDNRLFVGKFC